MSYIVKKEIGQGITVRVVLDQWDQAEYGYIIEHDVDGRLYSYWGVAGSPEHCLEKGIVAAQYYVAKYAAENEELELTTYD